MLNWYRANFKLKSGFASSWQSDTIFGHLCWGLRYLYGEDELSEFLNLYNDTDTLPLLCSNGFPGDFLPVPITTIQEVKKELPLEEQRAQFRNYKEAKQIKYLTIDDFNKIVSGEVVALTKDYPHPIMSERVTSKNQINRLTSTTDENNPLYNFEETFWEEVAVYLKIKADFVETARELFDYICTTGYGKRKSVGYGHIAELSFAPFKGFKTTANANGFVTLSNFVPTTNDPFKGNWQTLVKYGRMGEEYAVGENPFKKPLIMLEAGSTFYDTPCRECYGRMVKDLSYKKGVVQYGFALPVPMILP